MSGVLAGQVAIVSGASRGVGRTYALALAAAGARVVALARSVGSDPAQPGTLAELTATATRDGVDVVGRHCDLSDDADVVRTVEDVVASHGGVDVVVNNAVWPVDRWDPLAVPLDQWSGAMSINVRAPYVVMREAVPHMLGRGGGSIVNITSASAGVTERGKGSHDGLLAYGVSKAALERLTTYFAAEFADRGIAANAISPGFVGWYTERGHEPDLVYWGEPIVHLASQRPPEGINGEVLHTYDYWDSWGPRAGDPPEWNDDILEMLRIASTSN